jgi:hypothetical protein
MRLPLLALSLTALVGCTWVKLDDAGSQVRVAYNGNLGVASCRALGEIGVSVKDRVGFYQRNDLKVRDELETLARNEAVGLHADTITPLDEPHDGEQRFAAYACGSARSREQPLRQKEGEVQTYPAKEH